MIIVVFVFKKIRKLFQYVNDFALSCVYTFLISDELV